MNGVSIDSKTNKRKVRLIAYYLPQFHPTPENDEWWGKGFTEWTNTAKAKPLFHGHYQPHVPADLGFYDLRVPETRVAQAEMAQAHGIEGFCYWHYWFAGRRILERPFNEVLKSGEPKFPFCLGWANETWTGIWIGAQNRTLIEQTYPGKKDEEAHFSNVLPAFFDERYIKIDDKPVFYVYKPERLPEPKRFVEHWQELAIKSGLKGLYFIGEDDSTRWNPKTNNFDASVPHSPGNTFHKLLVGKKEHLHLSETMRIFLYEDYIDRATHDLSKEFLQYPSVLPNWDNTPRSGEVGFVLTESTPELFRIHLKRAIEQVIDRPYDHRVVFVKSWNEWAEGNYLEPDLKFGRGYLDVCRDEALSPEVKNG